jgi:uncharacterized membrane protein
MGDPFSVKRDGKVNPTVEKVTEENIESILCLEDTRRQRKPWMYRAVERTAAYCGTMAFLAWNVAVFAVWIGWNVTHLAFDPYPFTFLVLVVSLEAICLSILILISQNMSAKESERRHHLDLQINLLNERETTAMLRLVTRMAQKLGIDDEEQKEVRALSHDTDPTAVLKQIVKAEHAHRP